VRAVAAVADGGVKIKMERAQFLKSLPRVFYRIDTDGSGSIDMAEMRTAMQDCGVECTDVEMASMFIEADVDGDGSIDFAEFSSLMTNLYSGQSGLSSSTAGAPPPRVLGF
jgi:Ca2+-binding EF-hand superfamily protein